MRIASLLLVSACFVACVVPPTPAERVTDVARQLNLATRFGRMDVALEKTAKGARDTFMARRSDWGKEIRVVDFELAGLEMPDADHATVMVDVQWVKMAESTLHTTRIAQTWRNGDEEGWKLVREKRAAGDVGLFGERIAMADAPPREDVQFPSKTIR